MKTLTEERMASAVSFALYNSESELDGKIRKILINLGMSPKLDGYKYLRYSIMLIMGNGGYLKRLTAELYPAVGEMYAVRPHSVERSIRHAIDSSILNGKMERINGIIGIDVYDKKMRMTNSEFLSLLSEKIKYDITSKKCIKEAK